LAAVTISSRSRFAEFFSCVISRSAAARRSGDVPLGGGPPLRGLALGRREHPVGLLRGREARRAGVAIGDAAKLVGLPPDLRAQPGRLLLGGDP